MAVDGKNKCLEMYQRYIQVVTCSFVINQEIGGIPHLVFFSDLIRQEG